MTAQQIALVQQTFAMVEPILDDAAMLFYDRLFELDPSLRAMFQTPRREQARKLAHTLSVAVHGIAEPERLRPVIQGLGRRHAGYGVRDGHYETVGAALLWTLEMGLGAAFTPEVKQAWTATYGWITFVMREAGASEIPVRAA